ncbi:MAG: outer membrane beta-barrel protein [Endomicrobiaceae bacterium]|jgi:hypothetical protein|nr:outer membrane beta-barrel protein [Endomicrobiaceae bacterium]MDD3729925.1 outer membrane beta-barrel protein [Endomicrobiaceae bacterium]
MKKSILAVLLMIGLVVPAFCETLEVVGKAGYGVNAKIDGSGGLTMDVDSPFVLGAEGYMYLLPSVGIGAGISNVFDSKVKNPAGVKIGMTNIYVSVKPKIGFIADVYLLGQFGYGLVRVSDVEKVDSGIYWGAGAGIELMSWIVEVVYSNNKMTVKPGPSDPAFDVTHSMVTLNVGYKFAI